MGTYTILDTITGLPTIGDDVMGRNVEPSSTEIVVGNSDALDTVLSRHNLREAQQQASQLSKAKLEGRRKIFDRFAQDDELNKNRLNRWLNHTRELCCSYVAFNFV